MEAIEQRHENSRVPQMFRLEELNQPPFEKEVQIVTPEGVVSMGVKMDDSGLMIHTGEANVVVKPFSLEQFSEPTMLTIPQSQGNFEVVVRWVASNNQLVIIPSKIMPLAA